MANGSLFQDVPPGFRERLQPSPNDPKREEWDALMDWEDRLLTFANEVARRADALQETLSAVTKDLRVLRPNLAASVREDEREFWELQLDTLIVKATGE